MFCVPLLIEDMYDHGPTAWRWQVLYGKILWRGVIFTDAAVLTFWRHTCLDIK